MSGRRKGAGQLGRGVGKREDLKLTTAQYMMRTKNREQAKRKGMLMMVLERMKGSVE